MTAQTDNKSREKQRGLEREVLLTLREQKRPIKWNVLCAKFGEKPASYIESTLNNLKEGRLINVDQKQDVSITVIGLKRLEAGMF